MYCDAFGIGADPARVPVPAAAVYSRHRSRPAARPRPRLNGAERYGNREQRRWRQYCTRSTPSSRGWAAHAHAHAHAEHTRHKLAPTRRAAGDAPREVPPSSSQRGFRRVGREGKSSHTTLALVAPVGMAETLVLPPRGRGALRHSVLRAVLALAKSANAEARPLGCRLSPGVAADRPPRRRRPPTPLL